MDTYVGFYWIFFINNALYLKHFVYSILVTKKEVVFESCTDSEPERENKQVAKKEKMDFSNEKDKRKSNDSISSKTKKQTSLMNFFQSK